MIIAVVRFGLFIAILKVYEVVIDVAPFSKYYISTIVPLDIGSFLVIEIVQVCTLQVKILGQTCFILVVDFCDGLLDCAFRI